MKNACPRILGQAFFILIFILIKNYNPFLM